MVCLVCGGSKMAKAHIFPRSLIHEMKDGGQIVYGIERSKRGLQYYQSGPWEPDILCQSCEAKLSQCDDYAVSWLRTAESKHQDLFEGKAWSVPNPRPDLLVQFASAVLWRAAVANRLRQGDLSLGPWEPWLRAAIFSGSNKQPQVFVARKRYVTEGKYLGPILMHPYRAPGWSRRAYCFEIANFLWGVKLGNRSGGEALFAGPLAANNRDPLTILNMGDAEVTDDAGIMATYAAAEGLNLAR